MVLVTFRFALIENTNFNFCEPQCLRVARESRFWCPWIRIVSLGAIIFRGRKIKEMRGSCYTFCNFCTDLSKNEVCYTIDCLDDFDGCVSSKPNSLSCVCTQINCFRALWSSWGFQLQLQWTWGIGLHVLCIAQQLIINVAHLHEFSKRPSLLKSNQMDVYIWKTNETSWKVWEMFCD